jgi:NAD(P)-dependent dehydrogenase (short-subunit alcohol dehydrogenase family)
MRIVMITGASAGVGRATAREFAEHGYSVGLIARGEAGLAAAREECERLGVEAAWAACDVADAQALADAAGQLRRRLGDPDVWVNNAANSVFGPAWEVTPAEFERVTRVTYLGTVYGTLAALDSMRPRGRGRIVQVGSALAYRGTPLQAAYSAAKHAVQGFTDALRAELLHEHPGITVGMVQLSAVNTPLYSWMRSLMPRPPGPLSGVYPPQAAARAVRRAAESDVRELTVGRPAMAARIANAVAPGLTERYLAARAWDDQLTESAQMGPRRGNLDEPLDNERDWGVEGEHTDVSGRRPGVVSR